VNLLLGARLERRVRVRGDEALQRADGRFAVVGIQRRLAPQARVRDARFERGGTRERVFGEALGYTRVRLRGEDVLLLARVRLAQVVIRRGQLRIAGRQVRGQLLESVLRVAPVVHLQLLQRCLKELRFGCEARGDERMPVTGGEPREGDQWQRTA